MGGVRGPPAVRAKVNLVLLSPKAGLSSLPLLTWSRKVGYGPWLLDGMGPQWVLGGCQDAVQNWALWDLKVQEAFFTRVAFACFV